MQRQHTGRPGSKVIPDGWGATHSDVVTRSLESASEVQIGPAGSVRAWDEARRQTGTTAAAPVYSGTASLMLMTDAARILTVVEDPKAARVYEVTLPYAASALVAVGHVISVDPSDPDPMLASKQLKVSAIERGSRRFSRMLLAVLLDQRTG